MAYEKIGWKDYPDKTTPMSAKNLAHMEDGIKANDTAIGNIEKISSMGDGTCAGAIAACFQSVSDGKVAVATALTNKGVATANNATFKTMASNVEKVASNHYASGVANADNRANANSVNYKTGYNAGYNTGYTAGSSGKVTLQTLSASGTVYLGTGGDAGSPVTGSVALVFNFPNAVLGINSVTTSNNKQFPVHSIAVSGKTVTLTIGNTISWWSGDVQVTANAYGY